MKCNNDGRCKTWSIVGRTKRGECLRGKKGEETKGTFYDSAH